MPADVVQELSLWMLDAGRCGAMRPVSEARASASALGALRGLLSETPARSAAGTEAGDGPGVGSEITREEIVMSHPSRRAPLQLDLFLEEAGPTLPPGVPSWRALPDGMRETLTDLPWRGCSSRTRGARPALGRQRPRGMTRPTTKSVDEPPWG